MEPLIIIIIILIIGIGIAYYVGRRTGAFKRDKWWEKVMPECRRDAILRSRAVLGGHFSEQLAPFLPNFGHLPTECRFIGKPIDFIVFKGMDEKDIKEVVFVEVKSGKAKLTPHEKKLKDIIDKKKVKWVEYRIPKKLTDKGDIEKKIDEVVEAAEESIEDITGLRKKGKVKIKDDY